MIAGNLAALAEKGEPKISLGRSSALTSPNLHPPKVLHRKVGHYLNSQDFTFQQAEINLGQDEVTTGVGFDSRGSITSGCAAATIAQTGTDTLCEGNQRERTFRHAVPTATAGAETAAREHCIPCHHFITLGRRARAHIPH